MDIPRDENGDIIPSPPWHWLTTLGLWMAVLGALALVGTLFLPNALPPVAITELDRITMADEIRKAQNMLQLRLLLIWAGEKLLAGGFFMWLAGRVIDAFRNPKFY